MNRLDQVKHPGMLPVGLDKVVEWDGGDCSHAVMALHSAGLVKLYLYVCGQGWYQAIGDAVRVHVRDTFLDRILRRTFDVRMERAVGHLRNVGREHSEAAAAIVWQRGVLFAARRERHEREAR